MTSVQESRDPRGQLASLSILLGKFWTSERSCLKNKKRREKNKKRKSWLYLAYASNPALGRWWRWEACQVFEASLDYMPRFYFKTLAFVFSPLFLERQLLPLSLLLLPSPSITD